MVLGLARIPLSASLVSSICTAYEPLLQSFERRDLPRSSLPVVVTASATQSVSEIDVFGQQTDTPISSVVTATHVILTTTTVFTTIVSKAKATTFSPTNALQVLSAAERSFSIEDISSDSLPIVTDASTGTSGPNTSIRPSSTPISSASNSLLSSQINEKPRTNNVSDLPSVVTSSSMIKSDEATSATISSSSTLSIDHNDASLIHSSLASNDTIMAIVPSISASDSRSIGRDLVPSTLTVQNRVAPVSSTAKTGGTPQAAATVSSSSSVSKQRASWLRTGLAAIAALSFILR